MPDPSGSLGNVGSRAKHTTRLCHERPRPEAPMPCIKSVDDSEKDHSLGDNAEQDAVSTRGTPTTQVDNDEGMLDEVLENNDLETEHSRYLDVDGKKVHKASAAHIFTGLIPTPVGRTGYFA
ncbi:hypothetical protein Esi_0017_0065 [Ectocarpus siliculosus]|uniref:Uncharacterized protein n=1 Tax=Ectocarpus siliculosus TaxID=2880 RepID=D7FMK0_ECTSI|nr:hypothetical protein Esi_0017_0065 [Ectocarpus siliculosus]|eukprot:CBJ25897.1 hypothetical protein Esi_0017_0065 [Ectocarpus siliculosus]